MRKALMAIIAGGAAIATLLMTFSISNETNGAYNSVDLNTRPQFLAEYRAAREAKASWVQNAQEVALKFVATEECRPPSIQSSAVGAGKAVVTIQDSCLGDDSIAATLYRVELVRREESWEVSWAGTKHKCHPDRVGLLGYLTGYGGWHTQPCP